LRSIDTNTPGKLTDKLESQLTADGISSQ